jgi:hypothetical protein
MKQIPYVETVEDSRVRGLHPATGKRAIVQRLGTGEVRLYCISCHHPGAYVSEEMPGVLWLCDQFSACGCNCLETKGELPLPRLAL